jgi:hypothetical protein
VFEPGAFFQVTDREFDDRVVPMERISGDSIECGVGDERVVTPIRKQLGLAASEAGAAHNKANSAGPSAGSGGVVGFGDLGFPTECAIDVDPRPLGDRDDRGADRLVLGHGDRPQHAVAVERVDEFPGPKPRIGPQRDLTIGAGPADPLRIRA